MVSRKKQRLSQETLQVVFFYLFIFYHILRCLSGQKLSEPSSCVEKLDYDQKQTKKVLIKIDAIEIRKVFCILLS